MKICITITSDESDPHDLNFQTDAEVERDATAAKVSRILDSARAAIIRHIQAAPPKVEVLA